MLSIWKYLALTQTKISFGGNISIKRGNWWPFITIDTVQMRWQMNIQIKKDGRVFFSKGKITSKSKDLMKQCYEIWIQTVRLCIYLKEHKCRKKTNTRPRHKTGIPPCISYGSLRSIMVINLDWPTITEPIESHKESIHPSLCHNLESFKKLYCASRGVLAW